MRSGRKGEIISSQEAAPRPRVLRASRRALAPSAEVNGTVSRLANRRLSGAQLQRLARLGPVRVDEVAGIGANGYRKDAVPHNGRRSQ